MAETTTPPAAAAPEQAEGGQEQAEEIDVQQLADKVFQLLMADLRLERARLGRTAQITGRGIQ
ncbi:MAG TPA: hypothetical protein VFS21_19080 [Roseiflexaceae bacterium]|nr:hypothetical protein [Roseiflexaceae bacterium]